MKKIRVMVVDDSALMRKMISDILNSDPEIEVIATAKNGREAVDKAIKLKPDVITMDIEMPVMDGLLATGEIMARDPRPIVMLSSLTGENAPETITALNLGAVDFIQKPSGTISLDIKKISDLIIAKVKSAASANLTALKKPPMIAKKRRTIEIKKSSHRKIVLIASSTGGPRALSSVIPRFPGNFPYPILLVQHMPKGFTKSLAERLNKESEIRVKEAEDGEVLEKATCYIAPGGKHIIYKDGKVLHDDSPPIGTLKPAADITFFSVAQNFGGSAVVAVLTGMGKDGTEGVRKLKSKIPTYAIAESEETAVVYGMPKSLVNSGLADEVLPLHEICDRIIEKSVEV